MLDEKQSRMLELLEDQISKCKKCQLYSGGKCLPYWTPISEYLIVGEAPGSEEINNEPFVGKAGKHLWAIMEKYGLRKEIFAIINSVQCRPITARKTNGKPNDNQIQTCYPWIRKFIRILEPEKILILGNYAKSSLFPSEGNSGITYLNATASVFQISNFKTSIVFSIHPSMCIYKGEGGKIMLSNSIKSFLNL